MKYTLPKSYANAGLQVEIPDAVLKQYRSETGSTKAAVNKWLYENGHMAKSEYEAAEDKTVKPQPKREFKIDEEKASVIEFLAAALQDWKETMDRPTDLANVEIINRNRQISFFLGNDRYELTLVRKKQSK